MAWNAAAACFFGIAGVALATTLIVIYVVHKKKQKALKYKSDNSVRHNGVDYRYDPETKSIVESSAPVSNTNDSNNNLKKRSPPSTIDKKPSLQSVAQSSEKSTDKESTNVSKEVQTDPVDENQNNLDNPMSLEEKVNEYFRRNISVPDLVSNSNPVNAETLSPPDSSEWSNISSEKSTDSTKKNYKKKVHKSFKKYVNNFIETNCARHSAENSDTLSDADTLSESDNLSSASNSWSDVSSEKSTDDFEKAYKKKMHKTIRKFVKNMNKTETPIAALPTPSECSDETSSVLSGELEICMACEKNLVNTRTQPCNHRYMCSDCAMKFYKIYKKCKVCRARIEQYVVED